MGSAQSKSDVLPFRRHLICTRPIAFILRWMSEKWNLFLSLIAKCFNICILERHSYWELSIPHENVTRVRLDYGIVRSPSSVSGVQLDIQNRKEMQTFLSWVSVRSNQVFAKHVYGDVNSIQEVKLKCQNNRWLTIYVNEARPGGSPDLTIYWQAVWDCRIQHCYLGTE